MDQLEHRVGKLEDEIKVLSTLPKQLDLLIDIQRETNQSIKNLQAHMTETYVSKEILELKLANSKSELKLWIYGAIVSGVFSFILGAMQVYKLVVR